MKLRRAYRIYPTKSFVKQMINIGGGYRKMYNHFLGININQYALDKTFVWHFDMCKTLTKMKKDPNWSWLNDLPSQVLQQSLKDLNQALKNMKHGFGFPVFKSKYTTPITFRYPQGVKISDDKKYVFLPKIGQVRIKLHRALPEFTGCTIYQNATGWFASFVIDVPEAQLVESVATSVGIDLNSEHTALSDGSFLPNEHPMKKRKGRVKKLQQKISRQQKSSNNRKKTKTKLAKEHKVIADIRKNCLHQNSARIAKVYDLVVVETLKVKEMMQKSKPTAKAAADAGWGTMVAHLAYKTKLNGHHMFKINQWLPSSKTCSMCGNKKSSMPLNIRTYECDCCGSVLHRDTNAAINIKNWGLQQWHIENKTGQELPKVPVNAIWDILVHSGQITQTQMKQEATLL